MKAQKEEIVLLADAGGTFVKLAVAKNNKIVKQKIVETTAFQIDSFRQMVIEYRAVNQSISAIIIACAGPVKDGKCQLANANLFFDENAIKLMTGIKTKLINDLEAAAYSLKKNNKSSLMIGLGTGLGVSVIDDKGRVIASEEGHSIIDRELFMSVPELRNTIIPQYENILGAKKNILLKLLKTEEKKIILKEEKTGDKFTNIYLKTLDSFIQKMLSVHADAKLKKIIFIGGLCSGNKKILEKYALQLKKKFKKEIEIEDDKFLGVKGALVYYNEKRLCT